MDMATSKSKTKKRTTKKKIIKNTFDNFKKVEKIKIPDLKVKKNHMHPRQLVQAELEKRDLFVIQKILSLGPQEPHPFGV